VSAVDDRPLRHRDDRAQRELVVQENENADHLDLLGASCLLLARVVPSLDTAERRALAPHVRDLADALVGLVEDLGDRQAREHAADDAFEVATAIAVSEATPGSALAAGVMAVRVVAIDVIVFAGVEFDHAVDAVRERTLEQPVRAPAASSRGVVEWIRSRLPTR
jgi:hypothetical protein